MITVLARTVLAAPVRGGAAAIRHARDADLGSCAPMPVSAGPYPIVSEIRP
ncbi:MAG TPA: hypothetical protein VGD37_31445 [Kofleriaceae bacterium]